MREIAGLVERGLDRVSNIGRLVSEVVLALMTLLIVVDVFLRYVFSQPLAYSLELIEVSLSLVVFFALIVCTQQKGHIDISLVVSRFSPRAQVITSSFIYFLSTGLFALMTWRFFVQALHVQELGNVTAILRIPQYPFILVIVLCAFVVTLLLLSQFIHLLAKAVAE